MRVERPPLLVEGIVGVKVEPPSTRSTVTRRVPSARAIGIEGKSEEKERKESVGEPRASEKMEISLPAEPRTARSEELTSEASEEGHSHSLGERHRARSSLHAVVVGEEGVFEARLVVARVRRGAIEHGSVEHASGEAKVGNCENKLQLGSLSSTMRPDVPV